MVLLVGAHASCGFDITGFDETGELQVTIHSGYATLVNMPTDSF